METIADIALRYRSIAAKHMPPAVEQSSGFRIAFARCESPIEQAFCLALFQVPDIWAIEGDFRPSIAGHRAIRRGVLVFAQNPVKRYRADFLLVALSPLHAEPAFVIVECDGKEFHSTPNAIVRDARRARELRDTGFKIVRHSGAEIYDNPCEVVAKTLERLVTHGWDRRDAWSIDNLTIRRAMLALSAGDYDQNMGYRAPTLKPVSQSIANVLDILAGEVTNHGR